MDNAASGPGSPRLISVVIPTRDRPGLVAECIDSIVGAEVPDGWALEVVVVDDGIAPSSGSFGLDTHRAVRHVRNRGRGVNAARNTGIAEAGGERIVFIDDDEIVPQGYFQRMIELFEGAEEPDGVGGGANLIRGGSLRICDACYAASDAMVATRRGLVPGLLGGNMALRSGLFEEIGPFDDSLSGSGDESEWFARAKGHAFLFDPELFVWHRRDHLTPWKAMKYAFWQGRNIPGTTERIGMRDGRNLRQLLSALRHGVMGRCDFGYINFARELGAYYQVVNRLWSRSTTRGSGADGSP